MATILVIDDEGGYGAFLERYLSVLGFSAFVVKKGDQGLEFSKTVRPDLILLDWCLKEGFTAEETLRLFRSQPATQDVPVVVISGNKEEPEDEARARQAGACQFISKNEISDSVKDQTVFKRRLDALILGRVASPPRNRRSIKKVALPRPVGRVLLVDDDPEIRNMIALFLRDKGYSVLQADTASLGLSRAQAEAPDLIVLDLGLPDMDGLEVCSRLKTSSKTRPIPVLILTARVSRQSQLLAVEYMADHFLPKPLPDLEEFHGWVTALMRRRSHAADDRELLRVGDRLVVDVAAHTVTADERQIDDLPAILFQLLCELARRPGEVLSRDYLLMKIWHNSVRPHQVVTAVNRLKKRIGSPLVDWLQAVPGDGYRLIPTGVPLRPVRVEPPTPSENG
ncbi:MAG: response regulator [Elusimicrobiota bacterium]|nr:response regulator [Elusimicrobiota bacterium]